ncbi:hypothetical protein BCR33DRAFT_32541 [Rhizoclosmatium globosum]|uniref:Uncharacterized protein n=1 Tax=Rhizoclosmatium globosum TaxID=329046 RepID=A0A1Y2AWA3_9FUNG|nr:hypothetical protein BCR33DRAFT_32541 [Rhizoclosmatium globosum]|eukprot:ORY26849.1 hypothetical protein BCR33DRAFT_32541 [Rhizoclosmatium globosum]
MTLGRDDSLSTKLHEPIAVTIKSGMSGRLGNGLTTKGNARITPETGSRNSSTNRTRFRASAAKRGKRREAMGN